MLFLFHCVIILIVIKKIIVEVCEKFVSETASDKKTAQTVKNGGMHGDFAVITAISEINAGNSLKHNP